MSELILKGQKAKEASNILGNLSTGEKNKGLLAMADYLVKYKDFIIEANKIDLQEAVNRGTAKAMLDRLSLDEKRVEGMANGLRQVASLPDPVGEVVSMWTRPNGLQIGQKRVAMGVIGIIYEARPNVTSDAAGLCFKAGSAVILRGGKEAIYSNKAIVKVLIEALKSVDLPENSIQLIEDTSREVATEMMRLNDYIDVLIPRGGAGLIKAVVNNATVPVIETGTGNCHIYIDEECDFEMAKNIVINAKTSRPSVCNAAEKLLVNEKIADDFMPFILKELRASGVEVRGDESAIAYDKDIILASEEEWYNEYLDYKIGVKVVKDIDEAITHINSFSSGHSEAIVTKSYENSQKFLQRVNSAAVYVNASTRFTDGEEFGFGAEIGISTQKLHARGPMGLKELTTIKYIIYGNGQIR
ncbi:MULTISPECIES: glutamate-5-semialdehyde dehydrogenase [Clostridium]|jgi:glutamate-5-semialdehyde dehydrogenase|uniref:Gamma-glutamyl phosphate reductase n=1 Tax=Clostridium disporicum TaxID=84024 RepID=A0A174EL64_9CLOT|nr:MULTISPECIES: glutamate-5-semialdehyde dehydrogenase [Clostridium]MCD2503024.1 glutamate-5-semialdehyde dehydrogenase [Clostridium sp. NSJ-145]CUO38762.1 gamma-glutamyl phosphate reductase [Clostridium disporicum]